MYKRCLKLVSFGKVFGTDKLLQGAWKWSVWERVWNWSICGRCFVTGQFGQNVSNGSVCETYTKIMNMLSS